MSIYGRQVEIKKGKWPGFLREIGKIQISGQIKTLGIMSSIVIGCTYEKNFEIIQPGAQLTILKKWREFYLGRLHCS
jgi:hypothetical protein